jgi:type II secretory pathway component PulC
MAAMLAGGAALVALFVWQQSRSGESSRPAAPKTPHTATTPNATPTVSLPPIPTSPEPTVRSIAHAALQTTGQLNSGERVAKISVDGVAGVYLAGARLGANAYLAAIEDDQVRIVRDGKEEMLKTIFPRSSFGQRPQQPPTRQSAPLLPVPVPANSSFVDQQDDAGVPRYGATLTNLPGGQLAGLLGLQMGDTILQVNGRTVSPEEDLSTLLAELEARRVPIWVQGKRNGQTITLRYRP